MSFPSLLSLSKPFNTITSYLVPKDDGALRTALPKQRKSISSHKQTDGVSLSTKNFKQISLTTRIPFEIHSPDPKLKAKAEKIFQNLYSKEFFGSGKEACCIILDAFAKIASPHRPLPVTVSIGSLTDEPDSTGEGCLLGTYISYKRSIVLDCTTIQKLEPEEMSKEQLNNFMGTILHEMTHALYDDQFVTAGWIYAEDVSSDEIQTELGCTKEDFENALSKTAKRIPHKLMFFPCFPYTLADRIRPYFVPPADLVRSGALAFGFNEFLARIPEMYYRYGRSHTREEVDKALESIFPLGYKIFWDRFKKKFEELSTPLPKLSTVKKSFSKFGEDLSCSGTDEQRKRFKKFKELGATKDDFLRIQTRIHLEDSAEKLADSFEENLRYFANDEQQNLLNKRDRELSTTNDVSQRIHIRLYRKNDVLRDQDAFSKADVKKCIEKGVHCRIFSKEKELMLSTEFVRSYERLANKTDTESGLKLRIMFKQIMKEVEKAATFSTPLSKLSVVDEVESLGVSAKKLFSKLGEDLSCSGTDEERNRFKKFRELATTNDVSQRIQVRLYRKNDLLRDLDAFSRWDVKECIKKGVHYRTLLFSKEKELMLSTEFVRSYERLANKTDTESGLKLRIMFKQIIEEVEEATTSSL